MRSYSATPNLMTLQGRGFGPFFQVFSPAPRYIEGPLSLLKRATCRSLQVARFSTSRQSTPRSARESGIFSLGPTRLRFAGRWMFSRFQRTWDHPLTRSLQAISDTKVDHWILPANEPVNYFPAALRVKKLTPALPGRAKVIFSKIIVRTLVVPVYRN